MNYTIHIDVRVGDDDVQDLYETALHHAVAVDGLSGKEAEETLKPAGEIDVHACLIMLFDPGVSPSGCRIDETYVD
jgi:hypothetical protein